jgi:hypothetical protein
MKKIDKDVWSDIEDNILRVAGRIHLRPYTFQQVLLSEMNYDPDIIHSVFLSSFDKKLIVLDNDLKVCLRYEEPE